MPDGAGGEPVADGPVADGPVADSPVVDSTARLRLAREALARAKADALAKGNRPAHDDQRSERKPRADAPSPLRPGRRERRDDPDRLSAAIEGLISARGWRESAVSGSVSGRWAQIVGADLADHTRPDGLADGELTVTADSTAWATQVRLLAAQLVRRLNADLGEGTVQRVRVRGPASAAGPARKPGAWRVRGGRGPRDTYG
jgi:predicted nucleic acid-binding Zn ribbon protein